MFLISVCESEHTTSFDNPHTFSPHASQLTESVVAMRFSAATITLLFASINALSLRTTDDQSVIIKDELDVPGQSPLKFCEADRDQDIITIEEVVLEPNPPQAYVDLRIDKPKCCRN